MPLNAKQASQLRAFGSSVRRVRLARKITQEKLAELVDLNILLTTVLRLQKALGCAWGDLLGK